MTPVDGTREDRLRALEVDVDIRLLRVWESAASVMDRLTPEDRTTLACALRAAYGEGYIDALREDSAGRRCDLARTHGYAVI